MKPEILRAVITDSALVILLAVALYTDFRYARIFNVWTFPNMAAGLAINFAFPSQPQFLGFLTGHASGADAAGTAGSAGGGVAAAALCGFDGLLFSLEGLLVALVFMYLPFHFRIFGGGDVKLLMAVGAFKGPDFALWNFFYLLAFGAVLSAIVMMRRGILAARMLNAYNEIYFKTFGSRSLDQTAPEGKVIYAPAIIAGTFAAWIKFHPY